MLDRLRSFAVVAAAAAGLLGLGLSGAGEGSAARRDARLAHSRPMQVGSPRPASASACSAPLDVFCVIGLRPPTYGGRHSGGATR